MKNTLPHSILILLLLALFAPLAFAQVKQNKGRAEFEAFLTRLDVAQVELQNGKAEPFRPIWSQADDVTLSGGFGGTVEKGWTAVAKRLNWVGRIFRTEPTPSNGSSQIKTGA